MGKESETKSLQASSLNLHQNIELLRVELEQLRIDLVQATKCINDNETQICLLRGEASKLLDDNNLLRKQLIKSHDEVSELQIHLADANEIKIDLSSRIENIEMLNQKLELNNEQLNRQLTSSETEIEIERDRSRQFQHELDEMGQELKLANDKIGEMVKDHTKSTKSMKKLEAQFKTQQDQVKRLSLDTQDKSSKITELENQLKTERDDNENRLARLKKQHNKEKQNFKVELGSHLKTIDELKHEIDDIRE